MKICIVLPAFNEAAVIAGVVREVRALYPEVVVVDDGSSDDTVPRAAEAGAVVARHPLNRGQGAALQTGVNLALRRGADCIVTFDSDGQHRVEDIAALVAPIAEGRAEIALGTRFRGGDAEVPPARRVLLRCATIFTRTVSGARVTDAHNGLRAFSRRAASEIEITMDRMAHASELIDQIHRSGLAYVEVPVTVRYTEYSKTKGQRAVGAFRILLDYLLGRLLG
jgi:glycosyltransferase involved in cell wall biosynthesis